MKFALVFAIGIVFCIGVSEAVRCYQCTGSNQNCHDGECQGNFCYKTLGEVGGRSVVNKGCQSNGYNSCSASAITGAGSGTSCTCNGDWCNGSMSNTNIALPLLILAASAAFVMRKVLE